MHRGFEGKSGPGGWLIKESGHDLVLIVERPSPGNHSLHPLRAVKQIHQQGHCELLRFNQVLETRVARSAMVRRRSRLRIRNGVPGVHLFSPTGSSRTAAYSAAIVSRSG